MKESWLDQPIGFGEAVDTDPASIGAARPATTTSNPVIMRSYADRLFSFDSIAVLTGMFLSDRPGP